MKIDRRNMLKLRLDITLSVPYLPHSLHLLRIQHPVPDTKMRHVENRTYGICRIQSPEWSGFYGARINAHCEYSN